MATAFETAPNPDAPMRVMSAVIEQSDPVLPILLAGLVALMVGLVAVRTINRVAGPRHRFRDPLPDAHGRRASRRAAEALHASHHDLLRDRMR